MTTRTLGRFFAGFFFCACAIYMYYITRVKISSVL